MLLSDYQLSDPIELGAEGNFEAPDDGQLYVRCEDDWGKIADNQGTVTFKVRMAKK